MTMENFSILNKDYISNVMSIQQLTSSIKANIISMYNENKSQAADIYSDLNNDLSKYQSSAFVKFETQPKIKKYLSESFLINNQTLFQKMIPIPSTEISLELGVLYCVINQYIMCDSKDKNDICINPIAEFKDFYDNDIMDKDMIILSENTKQKIEKHIISYLYNKLFYFQERLSDILKAPEEYTAPVLCDTTTDLDVASLIFDAN